MGLFTEFFGYIFGGKTTHYSSTPRHIPEQDIRRLVSQENVSTLSLSEARVVEEAIIARRMSGGVISLRQIDAVLLALERERKISGNDRKGMMRVFMEYIANRR